MGAGVGWTLPETIQEYGQLSLVPMLPGSEKRSTILWRKDKSSRAFILHERIGGIVYGQSISFSGASLRAFFLSEDCPESVWDEPVTPG